MIDAVYAQVPDVACKGLCGRACGPIAMSGVEADRMIDRGILLPRVARHPVHGDMTCSHLTQDSRCAIYENRPLVCRLFGATAKLRCPYGCVPDAPLSEDKARALLESLRKAPSERGGHYWSDLG